MRISHGPIDVLGWPSMTMVFDVKPTVDLSRIEEGQDIRFSLVQEHAGEYVIAQPYAGGEGTGDTLETQAGRDPDSESSAATSTTIEPRRITAAAVVRGVDHEGIKLKLHHDPITELKWPSMTMDFNVQPDVSLNEIEEGQSIHFSMIEQADGGWVIDRIHVVKSPAGEDCPND
jgi:Cu(I)/Ag(I) efflux system membrane fusion protein